MLYDWRRCLSLAGAAAAVLFSTSCKDDPTEEVLPRNPSEGICFEPTFGSDDWNTMPQTRSGGVEEFPIDTTYVIEVPDATPEGEPLYVHVEVRDGIDSPTLRQLSANASQTRASMIDAKNFHPSFSAFAYSYEQWNGADEFNLMKELKVEKANGWATEVQWPKTGSVNFYAYAPHQSDHKGATITYKGRIEGVPNPDPNVSISTGDGLLLGYEEKGGVNFLDFVVGATGTKSYKDYQEKGEKPNMWFFHALAAVKVKSGSVFDRCYMTVLGFNPIYRGGTLRTHPRAKDLLWSDHIRRELRNLVYDPSHYFWVGPNQNMLSKNAADSVYFAVPQELVGKDGTETQLKIVYKSSEEADMDTQTEVLLPIGKDKNGNNLKWETGKTYTYTITREPPTTWDYTFEVEGSTSTNVIPEVLLHSWGTSGTINVKSHKKPQDGSSSQQSVDWSCEYSTDEGKTWTTASGGSFNNVLTNFSGSKSAPAGNGTNHKLTVSATFPETFSNEYDRMIASAGVAGSTQTYIDLSTLNSGSQNTANCYIVNRPGYYRIPLVYGNAIKNGKENTSAYVISGSHDNCKATWLTHAGNSIVDPWITRQYSSSQPFSCRVEWQDVENLVDESMFVKLNADNLGYLHFHVNPRTVKQGNAVISLLDKSGTVMWSWHIWLTPYKYGTTANSNWNDPLVDREIINNRGDRFTMMAFPLGYIIGDTRHIESKSLLLRFKQSGSNKMRTVRVKRQGGTERKPGHMPLYQFGRHVPIPGGRYTSTNPGSWDKVAPIQTWGKNAITSTIGILTTTKDMIQAPNSVYYVSGGMSSIFTSGERLRNRWDMACRGAGEGTGDKCNNGNALHTIKSVYDPSPAGYSLPTRDAFTGFCTQGTTARGTAYKNWSTPFKYESEFYAEYGCHFRVQINSADDQTLFLPTTGWRNAGYPESSGNSIQGTANQARYWTATYDKENGERVYSFYFSITNSEGSEENLNGKTMFIDTKNLTQTGDCMGVICVKD